MPDIPFPNVPAYPGVPLLTRPVASAIASSPVLAIALGTVETLLLNALQQPPKWGIFDSSGNQLGINSLTTQEQIQAAISNAVTGSTLTVLSTLDMGYTKESRVADFPVEGGGFATYNKVETPGNPTVTLALSGTESDRTAFLAALDDACTSPDLYNVVTPTVTYTNYTIERYTYARRATRGATLLIVEISLKEARSVSASLTKVAASPIIAPQAASATPQTNSGMTQGKTPDTSTLRSIAAKLGITN